MKRIAINGFGRIGRILFRILNDNINYQIVAINDLAPAKVLSHLLKYDSIHGRYHKEVVCLDNTILVDGKKIIILNIEHTDQLPWKDLNIDIVFECTGLRKTFKCNMEHITAGAKKVILSSPPNDDKIAMIVLGVNDQLISQSDQVISNASCTTNCAAPMIKVLDKRFGVKSAYVTTVHSYTSDQSLHDSIHNDLRRARSAPNSIIPTTTGAAKALSYIFPNIELNGCGIRVPVANCSLIDVTCILNQSTSTKNINSLFKQESANDFKDIICYNVDPIVSIDVTSSPYSCIFDSELTHVSANMVKVVGWYDNEYGYCSRLVDLLMKIT
tara:strand:- start:9153 stop:10136 length:984 start_codon:yes stop_codon:yes gene_type:complete